MNRQKSTAGPADNRTGGNDRARAALNVTDIVPQTHRPRKTQFSQTTNNIPDLSTQALQRRAERLLAGQLGVFRRMYDLAMRFRFYDDAHRLLAHLHALEAVRELDDMDTSIGVLYCNECEIGRVLDVWQRQLEVPRG